MIQTVTDRRAATYENVLTLPAESDIWGVYNCTVKNTFGATSATTTGKGGGGIALLFNETTMYNCDDKRHI